MKLKFLGAGSAFTLDPHNYQSSMLLIDDNKNMLLIDCGSDSRRSLYEAGFTYRDIHHIYITHLHSDHIGGLEWLAFNTKFDPTCSKPVLHISETMIDALWQNALSAGLSSLGNEKAELDSYFVLDIIKQNDPLRWQNLKMDLISNLHYKSNAIEMPTYGLFFSISKTKIWITGDTQFTPDRHLECYSQADLIFHDCETSTARSTVHAHYEELLTLPQEIRSKIWLYHYNTNPLQDPVKDGFKGFVKKGQFFEFV